MKQGPLSSLGPGQCNITAGKEATGMGKRNRFCGPYGMGALCATFFIGLALALFMPWLAIVLLCLVVVLAVLMLIRPMR